MLNSLNLVLRKFDTGNHNYKVELFFCIDLSFEHNYRRARVVAHLGQIKSFSFFFIIHVLIVG